MLGIVGESGSGKSQTSFAILGLLPPGARVSAERLQLDGIDLRTAGERQLKSLRGSRISYIPQEPLSNLDPSFTVGYQLVKPITRKLKVSRPRRAASPWRCSTASASKTHRASWLRIRISSAAAWPSGC